MRYEFRRDGGPWRPVFPMRGESLDEVFRQLGPGAEVRCVHVTPPWPDNTTATGAAIVANAAGEADLWARVEALEGRVSQLEAVREMGTPEGECKHDGLKVGMLGGTLFCMQCGTHVKGGAR